MLAERRNGDAEVGYSAVYVGNASAEFGHFVDLIDAFSGNVIEAVEIVVVGRDQRLVLRRFNGNNGLKYRAFAILDPLSHGVEVGRVVDGSREDAFFVFTLAFAVELFPPFSEVVELGVIVDKDLYLFAIAIEGIASGGVEQSRVLVVGCGCRCLLHLASAVDEGADVVACNGDGE